MVTKNTRRPRVRRKIGVYNDKIRSLQKRLSYERVFLTWKDVYVWKYLGDATEDNPDIDDIQNVVFFETMDRAYSQEPVPIPVSHEPLREEGIDLSRIGYISPLANEQTFRFHSASFEEGELGRYIIEGDILEFPFLEQDGEKAYFEVVDVDRKPEFENFYVVVKAKLMYNKRETQEIPDKNFDEESFTTILDDLEAQQKEYVEKEGLSGEEFETDLPEEDNRDDYDPRNDNQSSFLDDPNRTF